jgi:glyoxylase-like metal-dependent hydrolase (beta-lactamase superfamily II)
MHNDDVGMVEYGDMFWNRKSGNLIIKKIVNILFKIHKFKPDLIIDEGFNLFEYGFDARVIYLPGHSKGSIGILTSKGDLFCGDLFINDKTPRLNTIIDDQVAANNSVAKLKNHYINMVYPGHGNPFYMNYLTE